MEKDDLLKKITEYYLESNDFNGIPVHTFTDAIEPERLKSYLSELIIFDLVTVNFGDYHPNPHIKALPPEPKEEQLNKLASPKFEQACVYPTPKHLENVVDRSLFENHPFKLSLALGEPQLVHKPFDLLVLETYRNDPRYHYDTDDIHGSISIKNDFFETGRIKESDQVLLQSFGFCYDKALNRYVAVFLRYLADLSPEHQQIWAARQVNVKTTLHPDYFRTSILGDWPERISLFTAVLQEMKTINAMATAMGRALFFREDFSEEKRPREFSFLLRPTAKEFDNFVHLLDKMVSENINRDFFQCDVPYESEESRTDGKTVVRQKGTIQILEDWIDAFFHTNDQEPIKEILKTLRDVRQLRQRPAHSIDDNIFDQKFVHQQRDIMKRVYRALKILRLIFAGHPSTRSVEIPGAIRDGCIWNM